MDLYINMDNAGSMLTNAGIVPAWLPVTRCCAKAIRWRVWKLNRLGRDLRHLINTVHDLTARGVGLKVLT